MCSVVPAAQACDNGGLCFAAGFAASVHGKGRATVRPQFCVKSIDMLLHELHATVHGYVFNNVHEVLTDAASHT